MQYTVTISLFLYCIVFALLSLALSKQEMQLLQDMRLEFCKKMKQLYFDSILYIIVYNLFLVHFIEKLPLCHLLYIIVLSILVAFILSTSPSIHLKDFPSSQWNEVSFVRLASASSFNFWIYTMCTKTHIYPNHFILGELHKKEYFACLKLSEEHLTPVSASKLKWSILIVPRRYQASIFSPFSKGWGTIFFESGHFLATSWHSKNNFSSRWKIVSLSWLIS